MKAVEQLQQIPMFRELTAEEVRYLARKLEERDYKKDEVIYREGETPGMLYMIQHGAVEITKKTPTGHRQVIAVILAGQFFGESCFLENRPHAARAKATVDSRLFQLQRSVFDEMEREQPFLVQKLLREIILVMSANLDAMNDMFLQMIQHVFYGGKAVKNEIHGQRD